MPNPLESIVNYAKSKLNPISGAKAPDPGIGEAAHNVEDYKKMYQNTTAPAKAEAPAKPYPKDLVKPGARYGDRPGEKRPEDLHLEPMHPLGSFKKGGEVPKTGVYKLEKGEHVLTPEQKEKTKRAFSLAESALAHKEPEPVKEETPKKEIREMRIRHGASGGYIIEHHHTHVVHPMEEHQASHQDHLVDHVLEHMGHPDEGEEEAEKGETGMDESKESPAVEQMEKSLGYER
jgi:hypothetical protein